MHRHSVAINQILGFAAVPLCIVCSPPCLPCAPYFGEFPVESREAGAFAWNEAGRTTCTPSLSRAYSRSSHSHNLNRGPPSRSPPPLTLDLLALPARIAQGAVQHYHPLPAVPTYAPQDHQRAFVFPRVVDLGAAVLALDMVEQFREPDEGSGAVSCLQLPPFGCDPSPDHVLRYIGVVLPRLLRDLFVGAVRFRQGSELGC